MPLNHDQLVSIEWARKAFFSEDEIACKDGCGMVGLEREFERNLLAYRLILGYPMPVISGNRCPTHNKTIGGKPNSDHLRRQAVDWSLGHLPSERRAIAEMLALQMGFSTGLSMKDDTCVMHLGWRPGQRIWTY